MDKEIIKWNKQDYMADFDKQLSAFFKINNGLHYTNHDSEIKGQKFIIFWREKISRSLCVHDVYIPCERGNTLLQHPNRAARVYTHHCHFYYRAQADIQEGFCPST